MNISTLKIEKLIFLGLDSYIKQGYLYLLDEFCENIIISSNLNEVNLHTVGKTLVVASYIDYISICTHKISKEILKNTCFIADNHRFNNSELSSVVIGSYESPGVDRAHCPYCKAMGWLTNRERKYLNYLVGLSCSEIHMGMLLRLRFQMSYQKYSYVKRNLVKKLGLKNEYYLFAFCKKLQFQGLNARQIVLEKS